MIGRIPGLCGLVLAGGEARRLGGGDKPLREIGGRTMLERVIEVLAAEAGHVAISANGDPRRFARFGLTVLNDGPFAGRGPLAGVLAGLDWAAGEGGTALLTAPGDTPFLPKRLAAALGRPPACAESGGQAHHLVAIWPVTAREKLRQALGRAEHLPVWKFADEIGTRCVSFGVERDGAFLNVNTPEELARAEAAIGRVEIQPPDTHPK